MMRLFVAVWPSEEAIAAIERLERPEHPAVRWTTRDQWHVTLRFHGEVPEEGIPDLVDDLHAVVAPPRSVTLGPATCRVRRSVLVVPVSGLDDLTDHAHLTLARSRGKRSLPRDLVGRCLAATWLVDEVHLVRSHLEPSGARYETIATAPLTG